MRKRSVEPTIQTSMNTTVIESRIKNGVTIGTLGGRSRVTFGKDLRGLYCRTQKGNRISLSREFIDLTIKHYQSLKKQNKIQGQIKAAHHTTSHYNEPKWEDCPNNRACPYIAALIAHLEKSSTP